MRPPGPILTIVGIPGTNCNAVAGDFNTAEVGGVGAEGEPAA